MLVSRRRLASLALVCTGLLGVLGPVATASVGLHPGDASNVTAPTVATAHAPTHGTDAVLPRVARPGLSATPERDLLRLALAVAAMVACALFAPFCLRLGVRHADASRGTRHRVLRGRAPPTFLRV